MKNGCAGLFSEEQLDSGGGVVFTQKEINERKSAQRKVFIAPLITNCSIFDKDSLIELTKGNLEIEFLYD